MKHRAFTATTAQPNTEETDKLAKVPHLVGVRLTNGTRVNVKIDSSDPMTAIDEVNALTDEQFDELLTTNMFNEATEQYSSTLKNLGNG